MIIKDSIKLVCLSFIFLCYSCEKEKVERTYLSESERPVYDSLYNLKFDKIRKETDSLCVSSRDSIFSAAVDSMFTIRMQEINELINEQN